MWKIFDIIPGIVWAAIVALLLILSGVNYVRMVHAQGETNRLEVKMQKMQTAQATALQKAEKEAREREQVLQTQVERIQSEAADKAQVLAGRIADGDRAVARLRNDLKRLAATRPTSTDPVVATVTREASTVGELLGACAEEYRSVAQGADELRDQVTGLQNYIQAVGGR